MTCNCCYSDFLHLQMRRIQLDTQAHESGYLWLQKVLGPSFHSAELLPTLLWAMLKITAFVWKMFEDLTSTDQSEATEYRKTTEQKRGRTPEPPQKARKRGFRLFQRIVNIAKLSSSAVFGFIAKACAHSVSMALTIIWLGSPKLHSLPNFFSSAKEHGKKILKNNQFAESIVCGCVYRCL